jgi:hypothetical protein
MDWSASIGYGPLAFGGRMGVDECGPRAVVAHVLHQFPQASALVGGKLISGMAQIVEMDRRKTGRPECWPPYPTTENCYAATTCPARS